MEEIIYSLKNGAVVVIRPEKSGNGVLTQVPKLLRDGRVVKTLSLEQVRDLKAKLPVTEASMSGMTVLRLR